MSKPVDQLVHGGVHYCIAKESGTTHQRWEICITWWEKVMQISTFGGAVSLFLHFTFYSVQNLWQESATTHLFYNLQIQLTRVV